MLKVSEVLSPDGLEVESFDVLFGIVDIVDVA